jgi:3D-(3,5/4)-trihydroxycyclohexane-1,2-dione acylhydrolase (decyclizing)
MVPDPVLQQIEHPNGRDVSASDAFRPVSRFFDRISRPEQLLASLPEGGPDSEHQKKIDS